MTVTSSLSPRAERPLREPFAMLRLGDFTWAELAHEDLRIVATFLAAKLPAGEKRDMRGMPADLMAQVALAWARGDVAESADELRAMERHLLEIVFARPSSNVPAPDEPTTAQVLCRLERPWRQEVMTAVGASDGPLAVAIRRHILEFHELAALPPSSLSRILEGFAAKELAAALGPEDDLVRMAVLATVDLDRAKAIRRSLPVEDGHETALGWATQEAILAGAAELIDAGQIPWPDLASR